MKIDKSLFDDYAVLTLKGEFDTFYVPHFQEEIESVLDDGVSHVILNLRLVKFINSTALGAIIKAYKRCKAEGGDLVLCRPSTFVRSVIGKVGIDQLVPIYDDEEEAERHLGRSLANPRGGTEALESGRVLITFPDETRQKMVGSKSIIGGAKPLVGTMLNVDGEKLQFLWSGKRHGLSADQSKQLFFKGSEVRLKFQVKLSKKSFFELAGAVAEVDEGADDGARVTVRYKEISPADQEALSQFAEDMQFLKRQLPQ